MVFRRILLCVLLWSVIPVHGVFAQEDEEAFEPFVQSDLNILSGDVQRPNGLFWHDGYIYAACAGDFTLYRMDDETGDTITYIFGIRDSHTLYVEDGPVIWSPDFQKSEFTTVSSQEGGLATVTTGLAAPWGIAPSVEDDTFFMTQWDTDDIINVQRNGQVSVVATGFEDPSGIVVTEDSLYVANNDSVRRSIEWLSRDENGTGDPQPLLFGVQRVTNLVLGSDGLLYLAYALGNRGVVGRIDPEICKTKEGGCNGTDVEVVLWSELTPPLAGLTLTPDMRMYVHTMFGSEIYWVDLE